MKNTVKLHTTISAVCAGAMGAWMLAATVGLAQSSDNADQRTGVSHPDQAPITDASPATASTPAKPSAAVPMPATPAAGAVIPASKEQVYGAYVPYKAAGMAASTTAPAAAQPFDPDASIVTEATAGQAERRLLAGPAGAARNDVDAGIVTHVPSRPGEVPDGTLVKVKLLEELSTLTTQPGTKFTAEVSEPVMRDGVVIVPVGATLEGLVTYVHGGKRIGGGAAIHLEPMVVILPDGMQYALRARAIDTGSWQNTQVDDEGTITRRDHDKRTAAGIGLSAGGGAAAGAMMGGVPGAIIGAGVGAGAATVVWLKQDRQAELPKDLMVVFSLTEPMMVTPATAVAAPVKVGSPGGE